jgi:hypothetical protein
MHLVDALGEVLGGRTANRSAMAALPLSWASSVSTCKTHWMRLPSESTEETGAVASAAKP